MGFIIIISSFSSSFTASKALSAPIAPFYIFSRAEIPHYVGFGASQDLLFCY